MCVYNVCVGVEVISHTSYYVTLTQEKPKIKMKRIAREKKKKKKQEITEQKQTKKERQRV